MTDFNNKFSIIGGDIHILVRIKKEENWSQHPWRLHEKGNYFWVPLKDEKADPQKGKWVWVEGGHDQCEMCKRKFFYKKMEG
jgi:hypothetical protein